MARAHDALRLAGFVAFGVVEEVDAGVVGGGQAVGAEPFIELWTERDPRTEGELADLKPRSAQSSVFHVHGVALSRLGPAEGPTL